MKPKDLLEHLEKGDRTMQHLSKKPESFMSVGSDLMGQLSRFYGGQIANQQDVSGWTVAQMQAGNLYGTSTGGIQRW